MKLNLQCSLTNREVFLSASDVKIGTMAKLQVFGLFVKIDLMKRRFSKRQLGKASLRLLTISQIKFLINFSSGLSHVFTATVVLGFFFPGIAGEVSTSAFIIGLIIAISCFTIGLLLSRKLKE